VCVQPHQPTQLLPGPGEGAVGAEDEAGGRGKAGGGGGGGGGGAGGEGRRRGGGEGGVARGPVKGLELVAEADLRVCGVCVFLFLFLFVCIVFCMCACVVCVCCVKSGDRGVESSGRRISQSKGQRCLTSHHHWPTSQSKDLSNDITDPTPKQRSCLFHGN
jgi:hypothetical protein